MTIIKCKMCGGDLKIEANQSVGICEYCGSKQTLPRLANDRKSKLYNRASHFRRNGDYDKAMGIYEQILNEDTTDAEAYWSLVLCRYGIDYVEDPATHKRVPTVNRTQYTSIFADEDYKSAIANADAEQREVYEAEAKVIDDIQKGILEISQREPPFDVFICYKETDQQGKRTRDSVLAQEIYYRLTDQGYRVFFSRITLENVVGKRYEPYIFSALHSAKVMIVLGTNAEYLNAAWVKNEWSRFLSMMNGDHSKALLPCYKDMDPYDLPDELSILQAYDMDQIGFIQDLIRGVSKILGAQEAVPSEKQLLTDETLHKPVNSNIQALLDRGFLALEDRDWEKADSFFEDVLNQNAKCAQAYLGKAMIELGLQKPDQFASCKQNFLENGNYQKAERFADRKVLSQLNRYSAEYRRKQALKKQEEIYLKAKEQMLSAHTEADYKEVSELFEQISGFQDSEELFEQCNERYQELYALRANEVYNRASELLLANDRYQSSYAKFEEALALLQTIPEWKDATEKIRLAQEKMRKMEKEKKAPLSIQQIRHLKQMTQLSITILMIVGGYFFGNAFAEPDSWPVGIILSLILTGPSILFCFLTINAVLKEKKGANIFELFTVVFALIGASVWTICVIAELTSNTTSNDHLLGSLCLQWCNILMIWSVSRICKKRKQGSFPQTTCSH